MKASRYIRQTTLKEFGPAAQEKVSKASVLVVGAGGLGIPVLQYLNAMGIGTLGVVEQDIVELSNLQRQVLYSENDLGRAKLKVTLEKLKAQNSNTEIKGYDTFLVRDNALKIIKDYDLVIDASDNFPTRYLINDACVILKKPFVYGALHSFEGQLSVFNYKGGPTYRCFFPEMPSEAEIPDCNENGVLGVIPGIVGNLQALEAIKIITGIGEVLSGKLLLFNGLNHSFVKVNFSPNTENLTITNLKESYGVQECSNSLSITVSELQQLLTTKNDLQIVDVRTEAEYDSHHLPGAINIPLEILSTRVGELNHKHPVYFICQSGRRSAIAQQQLQPIFSESLFYNVNGGLNQYTSVCT